MTGYRHILVPLDGSLLAAQALPHAQAIAQRAQAHISLLQVVPELRSLVPEPGLMSSGAFPLQRMAADEQLKAIQEQWQRYAYDTLHAQVQTFAEAGIDATATVEIGAAAETIVAYATEQGVDLIVMSTHGRSGLTRWLHGSVAARVIHTTPCPVLLVRPAPAPESQAAE
jgi:nucleotide-binding universal stress UspA family protein